MQYTVPRTTACNHGLHWIGAARSVWYGGFLCAFDPHCRIISPVATIVSANYCRRNSCPISVHSEVLGKILSNIPSNECRTVLNLYFTRTSVPSVSYYLFFYAFKAERRVFVHVFDFLPLLSRTSILVLLLHRWCLMRGYQRRGSAASKGCTDNLTSSTLDTCEESKVVPK